jgi:hypothetical protein
MGILIPEEDRNLDSAKVLVCEIGKPKILKKGAILRNYVREINELSRV